MKLIDNMSFKMKCFLGGLAIAGLLLPFIFYFSIFGPLSAYSLARNDQIWANFGTFIGGTVGPILSTLACIAVFLTYRSQNEQITLLKKQAKIDEAQRLVASTCQQIEQILSTPIVVSGINLHLESCILYKHADDRFEKSEGNEKIRYESSRIRLLIRLREFCIQIELLDNIGAPPDIISAYKGKFILHVEALNEIDKIELSEIKQLYNLS
ncbi:hypothetical protein [Aeromonas hydrophila]|uniref:hypothetical protein n=1 Tax=Aeromonas hydrophila TaxID=644 RepID=UPI0007449342|nr:hypothetical protein [Aeromonas hydrophila]ALZ80899.1 hypothetical protein AhyD4_15310 [Aeromonas hydrophila]EGX6959378.1 hypothetical protein [Aeromonas hydrophila]MCA4699704.1 hypothetical protein [Aeromonas hydrophila]MCO4222567.1 hypothetical protein [Aeromonas hydrophila]QIO19239.1 hypothetical protein G9455_15880 [Aeromonas hydrophila]